MWSGAYVDEGQPHMRMWSGAYVVDHIHVEKRQQTGMGMWSTTYAHVVMSICVCGREHMWFRAYVDEGHPHMWMWCMGICVCGWGVWEHLHMWFGACGS